MKNSAFDYQSFISAAHDQRGTIGVSEFIESGNPVRMPDGKFKQVAVKDHSHYNYGDTANATHICKYSESASDPSTGEAYIATAYFQKVQ